MFSINLSSPEPIYNQIINQIKLMLESGELNRGDHLPSIRSLASQLDVSINTVARAYRDLETEGIVESNGRKGSYISKTVKDKKNNTLFVKDIFSLKRAGLNKKQIKDLFKNELNKQFGGIA